MPLPSTPILSSSIALTSSAAGLAALLTYLYYNRPSIPFAFVPLTSKTFTFKVLNWDATLSLSSSGIVTLTRNISAWGTGPETHTTHHIFLSPEECQRKLTRNQSTYEVDRPGNPIVRIDTNFIEANYKCEDDISIDLISSSDLAVLRKGEEGKGFWEFWGMLRNKLPLNPYSEASKSDDNSENTSEAQEVEMTPNDDLCFLSVIDGHGGGQTSSVLRKVLHGTLSWGLAGLKEWTSKDIYHKIKETYLALDEDIYRAGLSVAQSPSNSSVDTILPTPNPSLLSLIPVAGATTCTAFIDVRQQLLYVINIGDSRAVAGWLDEESGQWRVDVLSQDQECGNPAEVKRLQNMHSPPLSDAVIDEGYTPRLLGNLQPSRAFGDDCSKLTRAEKESLSLAGQINTLPEESPFTKKPISYDDAPYMDAWPEIVIRNLRNKENPNEKLEFLIIATDGLWDKISSEEAILLLAAHSSESAESRIAKTDLPKIFPQIKSEGERPYPAEELPGTTAENSTGHWVLEDDNAATHLIRNGLDGHGDEEVHRMILSLTGSGAREVRDDTSVM
ncbi:uncharacterized protein I303_105057 [Kwoniella dejecticola CBS 10117]|uniref:PPM-type phosphatase domain-containing protein n=1 Tax=Kwoniella dejecticola CBS 10117 TaxID=1296121 RepID=A0A1A6A3K3_9TREE|nr:uncharacterized protein I303_05497 [Kwoniella dejecticola CBS 10117]OBR84638.1 hypothetical protein I303_05497 [Kwoniella dejecticola CBS 10117]